MAMFLFASAVSYTLENPIHIAQMRGLRIGTPDPVKNLSKEMNGTLLLTVRIPQGRVLKLVQRLEQVQRTCVQAS